jgi:hypothetical protein
MEEPPPAGGTGGGGQSGAGGGPGIGGSGGSGGSSTPDAAAPDTAPPPPGGNDGGGGDAAGLPPSNSPVTQGFMSVPFTFNVQSPYQVPRGDRYTFDEATNTHTMWVKSDDSSFQAGNGTDPRCELRHRDEWTSGQHILEADVWIAPTTHRTSILQIFSTSPPTTFMLTAWNDRTLRYYFGSGNGPVIMRDAFDKWFNLKVLHDVSAKQVTVFINDVKSMSFRDKGSHWHFKNGVYGCRTERCETRWRNIRHWVK